MFNTRIPDLKRTWLTRKGETYGAKPDGRGPTGGQAGYQAIVTSGDHTATTFDELLEALAVAKKGETVFIPGNVTIDCTARIYIEGYVLNIPAGVTLASDRGHGRSKGALIVSDTFKTKPLFEASGPNVRVTGLRLQGPDPKRRLEHHDTAFVKGLGRDYYYKFPISDGICSSHSKLEVDNCELAGWSHAGVGLHDGTGHHIHHNFIHHCQFNGLGYGVCLDKAEALIEHNVFNYNRHSIAGTGAPGSGYEACHNVEVGTSLHHCFDMHGGRDRGDGTNIAGAWMKIHHNTFRSRKQPITIRGKPQKRADIQYNWFCHHLPDGDGRRLAVHQEGRTRVRGNAYGVRSPRIV